MTMEKPVSERVPRSPAEPIHVIRGVSDEFMEEMVRKGLARRIFPPEPRESHDELDRQVDTERPVTRGEARSD